jgi:hypothetical protein
MYLRALLGAALLLLGLGSPAQAQIVEMYRWTDAAGIVHFTNNLNEIPEQFRSGATLIRRAEMPPAPVAPPAPERASIQFQRRGDLMVVKSVLNGSLSVNLVGRYGRQFTRPSRRRRRPPSSWIPASIRPCFRSIPRTG